MKNIILIEDDAPIRDAFQVIFKGGEVNITALENGDSIINHEAGAPDLFLLDKQLSGINGLDICRFIKSSEKYKHVPVIMLSANPDIVELAKDAGADNAIEKPFSLKKVRETVYHYIT